jgi:hypothetical protein
MRSQWLFALPVVLYAALYLSLLQPVPGYGRNHRFPGESERIRFPEYRIGGEYSKMVFTPLQRLDRLLRPTYWYARFKEDPT